MIQSLCHGQKILRLPHSISKLMEKPILPQKKTNPHALVICPWDAIELVPTENAAQLMAQIGGPPDYIRDNWDRLVGTAQHLAELKAGG